MSNCFVIQPFDGGKFDKRFADVFKPAIESAGLQAYRTDLDANVDVPIESIEEGIKNSTICLADISTDNPNVWYELGYAFASGRQVIMVCSDERISGKYPFDIQHRTILKYKTESLSDYDALREILKTKIEALLTKSIKLRQIADSERVAPTKGVSQSEMMVLAVVAAETSIPGSVASLWSLKDDAERAGLTAIGFSLGLRRLLSKNFAEEVDIHDENGDDVPSARLTQKGWDWIENNEALFVVRKKNKIANVGLNDLDDVSF